jgi:hypothetical protein
MLPKVGGQVAANFTMHKSIDLFMLTKNQEVGGHLSADRKPAELGGQARKFKQIDLN